MNTWKIDFQTGKKMPFDEWWQRVLSAESIIESAMEGSIVDDAIQEHHRLMKFA